MNEYFIEDLCSDNNEDWEEFNRMSIEGSFFHTLKWKNILENSFNLKSKYFLVYQDDKVVAICPFFEDSIKGFKGLCSLPKSDKSTIIIDEQNYNRSVIEIIFNKAKDLSTKNKLNFILISILYEDIKELFNELNPLDYPFRGNMILDLEKNNPNKIWNDIFSKRAKGRPRLYIRRFEKDGIKIKEIGSLEDLKIFYKYYEKNLEFINAIPYSFSHFEQLWNTYATTDMRITLLHKDEKIFGGIMAFLYPANKTMYLRYLALNRQIPNRYNPIYYLMWDAVLFAFDMRYKTVNFGSTSYKPDDVHYRTKMKFGSDFEKEYLLIFPLSITFKTLYKAYKIVKS